MRGNNISGDAVLSDLPELSYLMLNDNKLSSIDLSGLSKLLALYMWGNELVDINLNGLDHLSYFYLNDNKLSSIDLSGLNDLVSIRLMDNQLTNINLA
jgi:protein phosphatase 1 regulatory subunit 7